MSDSQQNKLLERYQRAQTLEQGVFTKRVARNTSIYPHWANDSSGFGYYRDLKDGGREYRWVEIKTGENRAAPEQVPASIDPNRKTSPDGHYTAFTRDHNLWILDNHIGEERALTTDGDAHYVYGGTATAYGRQEAVTLEVLWSPDSTRLLAVIKDNRDVKVGPPLVEHVPADGSLRPRIVDGDRRVAFPGDEHIEGYRLVSIAVDSGEITPADYPPCPVFAPPYIGFFTGHRGWWSPDNRKAYFIDLVRGGRKGRLIEFDTHTGQARMVIEETTQHRFCFIPESHLASLVTPVPGTEEVIWYSERSGWAHLYLYDLQTGELKNTITAGEWVVRNILHIDSQRREVWIQTAGRYSADQGEGRNPYYSDICRVHLDTGELTEVISTDHDYAVCDGKSRFSFTGDAGAQGVSADGHYVIATRSRVDQPPVHLLLDRDGNTVMIVDEPDLSDLPAHWQWPEPVLLTAADGKTTIDGVVWRPSDFDPNQSYPVIDCSFGVFGPPVGSFTNNFAGDWMYLTPAALAELGFITVMIGQRGAGIAQGLRNVSYTHDKEAWNCISPHQEDCVAGIKQLAEKYPYMDIDRVGIGAFLSTHSPLGGILRFPDFYKVAVGSNAYLDHRIVGDFYSDCYDDSGEPLSKLVLESHPFHELVKNLKGKLLLIHGMMNPCTPVAATFGFVEALQKANKDFDLLILPNLGHEDNGYTTRLRWDYFVEHLLGEDPPKEFKLTTGIELLTAQ